MRKKTYSPAIKKEEVLFWLLFGSTFAFGLWFGVQQGASSAISAPTEEQTSFFFRPIFLAAPCFSMRISFRPIHDAHF